MPYTEEKYENAIIQLFEEMGYTHAYDPAIDRDYRIPLYMDELTAALYRLNPTLPHGIILSATSATKRSLQQNSRTMTVL